jgi:hypothetical protein
LQKILFYKKILFTKKYFLQKNIFLQKVLFLQKNIFFLQFYFTKNQDLYLSEIGPSSGRGEGVRAALSVGDDPVDPSCVVVDQRVDPRPVRPGAPDAATHDANLRPGPDVLIKKIN